MAWVGFTVPFILWARTRMTARSIAAYLSFFALVCLGTTITGGVAGKTLALIATLLLFLWSSVNLSVRRRRAMIAFAILVIVISSGWSPASYVPAEIAQAFRNLGTVGVATIADDIDPDTPTALLQAERTARDLALIKELANYQRLVDRLDLVRSTRSLTDVEWGMYQQARSAVVRINEEMSASRTGSTLPVRTTGLAWLIRVLILITLVLLALAAIWVLFRHLGNTAETVSTEEPAVAVGSHGERGFSRMPWARLAAIGVIAAALLGIGLLANSWLVPTQTMGSSIPRKPAPAGASPDLAAELAKRTMDYEVTEDTGLYNLKGDRVLDIFAGTQVAYAGPGQEPDPEFFGPDTPIRVAVPNDRGDFIRSTTGFIPARKLKKLVKSPPPPAQTPPQQVAVKKPYLGYTFYFDNNSGTAVNLWWRRDVNDKTKDIQWTKGQETIQPGGTREQFTTTDEGIWVIKDLMGNDLMPIPPPVKDGDRSRPITWP